MGYEFPHTIRNQEYLYVFTSPGFCWERSNLFIVRDRFVILPRDGARINDNKS